MYPFLDRFFSVFHSGIILFIVFGWIWQKTRRAHLITVTLTAFSWFVLGIWHGIGYCPCTDWHWQVREKLGQSDMPNSYVKFLVVSITGLDLNASLVDISTLLVFIIALLATIYANWKDWGTSKNQE
ncbi:DUF2784 domain-containing protein [bacterium]|nr:DUF2784 domain-containing protein [bacterium]